eukprot:CAMPEP_0171779760 /NCGR_PEP_ID=MMETSP0991-20121206/59202_1 /TAXON_ID=483369 /ORGANISM="non described non described, Strain CCMP2098" /LENGTH=60 /DNA_ID=CAMNT_0012386993 /DNA_START=173 /DNA_END=355 /DNA_ORIENTATION=+
MHHLKCPRPNSHANSRLSDGTSDGEAHKRFGVVVNQKLHHYDDEHLCEPCLSAPHETGRP